MITIEQIAAVLGLAKIENLSLNPKSYEVVYKLPPIYSINQLKFFRFMSDEELAFHTICEFSKISGKNIFEPVDPSELMKLEGFKKFAQLNQFAEKTHMYHICLNQFIEMVMRVMKSVGYEKMIEIVQLAAIQEILDS